MLLSLLLSGFVWAQQQTMPWQDANFGCLDQTTAQKYVQDFHINTKSFGGMELCNAKVDTKKLFNDLTILEKGRFRPAQKNNVFIKGFVPQDQYYTWMKAQTRSMNRGNDIPYATAYNSWGNFTMQDGWALLSTLGRVGTIVHEARHTEGFSHIRCTQGPYEGAGTSGCDRDYNYGGSHGVEMEYYARVSVLGTNFHPVYKTMARLMAVARSNFVFNQPVIRKKEAVLALSATQGRADLIIDNQVVSRPAPAVQGALKRTSFGGVVFDGRNASSIELYGSQQLNTLIQDTYSYYKLIMESPQAVFDFEEFDIGTKRFVAVMPNNRTLQFYSFPNGKWDRAIDVGFEVAGTATRLENNQAGYFLIDKSGSIYPVNAQNRTIEKALPFKWNSNIAQVAYMNNKQYILGRDGGIYDRTQQARTLRRVSRQTERYRGLINTPVYDGFEVSR